MNERAKYPKIYLFVYLQKENIDLKLLHVLVAVVVLVDVVTHVTVVLALVSFILLQD